MEGPDKLKRGAAAASAGGQDRGGAGRPGGEVEVSPSSFYHLHIQIPLCNVSDGGAIALANANSPSWSRRYGRAGAGKNARTDAAS